jgi:hypothetical protein
MVELICSERDNDVRLAVELELAHPALGDRKSVV